VTHNTDREVSTPPILLSILHRHLIAAAFSFGGRQGTDRNVVFTVEIYLATHSVADESAAPRQKARMLPWALSKRTENAGSVKEIIIRNL